MNSQNDTTRVQPGQALSKLPARLEEPAEIVAYQRSPTLMAGKTPGSQGPVRVWAPNRRAIRNACAGWGAFIIVMVAVMSWTHGAGSSSLATALFGLCVSLATLWRPCYMTTDDEGIGITTLGSSRALCWNEIVTARLVVDNPLYRFDRIVLMAPSRVTINLTGYSSRLQIEIFGMILRKAQLQPHPARPKIYVNPSRPLPEGIGVFESGNTDILACLAAGDKKSATQIYRRRYQGSRRQARNSVEAMELNLEMVAPDEVLEARCPDQASYLEFRGLLAKNKLKTAIEVYRRRTGSTQQVAEDTVNLMRRRPALPRREPRLSALSASTKNVDA